MGKYMFIGIIGAHVISKDLAVSTFEVMPQFPAGTMTAVIAPIAALGGFWALSKRRQAKLQLTAP